MKHFHSTAPDATGEVGQTKRNTTRNLLGVVLIALPLSVTACQSAPSPAPSHPTATPTLSREQVAYAEAEAAYRNYAEIYDQVAQDYYRGWQEKLQPLASEPAPGWGQFFVEGEAGGYHQVGDTVIDSTEAWGYKNDDPDTGRETVNLRVCVDSTSVQELSPEGVDMLGEGTAGKFYHVVTMKHEPGLEEKGRPLPDTDDPHNQSWWRWAGATTRYETC